jgi:hypothetical protein
MELLKWYQLRESPNLPIYAMSPRYWTITVCMVLAAGVLGILYGTTPRNAIMVLNIGVSAPLLIKMLAEMRVAPPAGSPPQGQHGAPAPPQVPGYQMDNREFPEPGVWHFLSWR